MSVSPETRDRIVEAAERLFEQSGRDKFPSVDSVRREARADMNTTSLVMKEWRKAQTASPSRLADTVPDEVKNVFNQALAAAWQQAQDHANESLASAQAAWDIERQEAEDLRKELSEAYETQVKELEALRKQVEEHDKEAAKAAHEILDLKEQLSDLEKSATAEKAQLEKELAVASVQLEAASQMRDLLDELKKGKSSGK